MSIIARASHRPWLLALCWLASAGPPLGAQLVDVVDYSDTFTVAEQGGIPERPDGSFNQGSPGYDVEDAHGNPTATWTPFVNFSFNTGLGSTCCGYPTNDGNPGAATGVAQSGGNDFSFAYGLRTNYVVQLDAILPPDRLDISSLPNAGDSIFAAGSLSVFFRREPQNIGLFNGAVETPIIVDGQPLRTGVTDFNWHNYAVQFNQDASTITLFVDQVPLTEVDLTTFAGGIYNGYSNGAVGSGGTFVLWVDNVQVGSPATPPTSACFTASATAGLAPLPVDFDATCSFLAAPAQSYEWDFGDGTTSSGQTVQHVYTTSGRFDVVLTLRDQNGGTDTATRSIVVNAQVSSFSDAFDRADGPIDGWSVFSVPGTWNLLGGELATGPTNEERWIWAGDPPFLFPDRMTLEFDMRFNAPGTVAEVGRHAGAVFCGNLATHRYDPGFRGYFIDWIDRPADHGLRFTRVDAGQLVEIVRGAPGSPVEPPLVWRVEITGPNIRVYGDDTLYIDVQDATYRGGFAGLWTWAGGQDVAYDEFSVSVPSNPLTACFSMATGFRFAGQNVAFDAACSENVGAGVSSYAWDFGDGSPAGSGQQVSHAYAAPGTYQVTLTLSDTLGNSAAVTRAVTIYQRLQSYSDDFQRADGPVSNWTVYSVADTWNIVNGELQTGPTSQERFVWAGDTPIVFPRDAVIEWDQIFRGPGSIPAIGRHAGMVFCGNEATHRGSPTFSGYFVDWIDRADDRGLRLSRVDTGRFVEIIRGQASIPVPDEPPTVWRVEMEGDHIRLFGDDVQYFDVVDSTYRGGLAGFWTWEGGQEVTFDNFFVTGQALSACFTASPSVYLTGVAVTLDGSCSESFGGAITAYEWDFGDGATATGASASHTYTAAGVYTLELTVRDGQGGASTLSREITVENGLLPFADCFDRAEGPVDGWTATVGTWTITADGSVETVTGGGEGFLYAGDPPRRMLGDFVAQTDWELVAGGVPGVGRHAALHFFWNEATTNRFLGTSHGYALFYIDRAADRGLSLFRFANGGFTVLNPPGGTPSFLEPPATLRIEVTGPRIQVFADDALAIDVEDDTYRDGYFALWAYNDNTARFDNVRIGSTQLPDCDGGPPTPRFVRGDSSADANINLTDALVTLLYLFSGGPEPACLDAADADDNGQLQLTDAIRILAWLFLGGPVPPAPSPSATSYGVEDCGTDPSPEDSELGCASFGPCA